MQRIATDQPSRELIKFLTTPATYSSSRLSKHGVETIETHISQVFLVGDEVYKLKKPVKFDFLDFSTVAKRRQACLDEVRLNGRMAPSVYLGVLPVRRKSNGALVLGGKDSDEIVDWLVRMRRLDADRTFGYCLQNNDESSKLACMGRVADHLADFFVTQAPATVKTDDFRDQLRRHIDDNQTQLLELVGSSTERDRVRCIHSAQLRFLVTHRELFDSRVLDGRIVDGHGDLRPDHIYLYHTPSVIDCIEFNSTYRINDVIDELAFLAMCCDRVGEQSVGDYLFRAYEQQSGDRCHSELIGFYKSYRACVRAKVAGLRGLQEEANRPAVAAQRLPSNRDYLDLASRYIESFDQPVVMMIGGLMGSGKSTLARELQALLSAELVSSDAVRQSDGGSTQVAGRTSVPDYGAGRYTRTARLANYRKMVETAKCLGIRNRCLVFDATFSLQSARQMVADFADEHGYQLLQVECLCPREEAIARIRDRISRGDSLSEAIPEHYDQQVAEAEPTLSDVPTVGVDTTLSLPQERAKVLEALIPLVVAKD